VGCSGPCLIPVSLYPSSTQIHWDTGERMALSRNAYRVAIYCTSLLYEPDTIEIQVARILVIEVNLNRRR